MPSNPVRVLLADDEGAFATALARVLRHRGMEVSIASSGPTALALALERPFDVAVLDMRMPGLDGVETMVELRRQRPDVAMLLLTAHAEVESASRAVAAGAADVLIKPCPIDNLVCAIEDAVERTTAGRRPAPTSRR